MDQETVSNNLFVFIQDNRKDTRVLKISQHKNFKWRKMPLPLHQICKYPFFTMFEVGNNNLSPVQWENEEGQQPQQEHNQQVQQNNKDIFLIEDAQKLQAQQIEKLKQNLKPQQLIDSLIENNEQFDKRTTFSKEKYVKKKKKKYMFRIHVEPTTVSNLYNHYYRNHRQNVCGIRWDIFALTLLHGGPYTRVLIAEQGKGILLGAVLERNPQLICVVGEKHQKIKQYPIIDQLNISKKEQEKVHFHQWNQAKQNEQSFDNFLLMGNYDFRGMLEFYQSRLNCGCIITFTCPSSSPLEEAGRFMKQKGWLNIRMWDSWCREYQVLQSRTHPMMSMDSCSGYLLSAIKS